MMEADDFVIGYGESAQFLSELRWSELR